jgi:hypothetical protein
MVGGRELKGIYIIIVVIIIIIIMLCRAVIRSVVNFLTASSTVVHIFFVQLVCNLTLI